MFTTDKPSLILFRISLHPNHNTEQLIRFSLKISCSYMYLLYICINICIICERNSFDGVGLAKKKVIETKPNLASRVR